MKELLVKDIMVPLEQYATVREDANLYEAVTALEECQERADIADPRAVLVVNKQGHVVGKLSLLDVIRALEPSYGKIMEPRPGASRIGFSNRFLKLVADDYKLWSNPLDQICKKAATIVVRDVMYAPATEGEFVPENATLAEALHQVIMGHHQSLLVVGGKGRITGILRVKEVFQEIARRMKACGI